MNQESITMAEATATIPVMIARNGTRTRKTSRTRAMTIITSTSISVATKCS